VQALIASETPQGTLLLAARLNFVAGQISSKSTTYDATLVSNIIKANPVHSPVAVTFLTADDNADGQRLDNFLLRHLKGVPKTHVYRIIRSGEVRVNKGRAQADTRVQVGDVVRVPPLRVSQQIAEKAAHPAPPREFPILFEDDHLLAIDKPAGVAVHGGSGVSFGVIEQLRQARPQARFLELVHRLDKETSGILLIAKRRSALTALQAQFKERETDKIYLATVKGDWPANKKVLDAPLHKYLLDDGERRVKVVAKDDPDGMKAVTLVKVKQRFAVGGQPCTLLEVTIKTGRTHQIRVHLASAGGPILGDDKYGDFEFNRQMAHLPGPRGLRRMFLHAWSLRVVHPASQEPLQLLSELPQDLRGLVWPENEDHATPLRPHRL
jgi:23S rRNA pseudouridine955/2504/2580 synthase